MPTNVSVDRALAAIAKDESKKLDVSVNGQNITTGQHFKRAGELQNFHPMTIGRPTDLLP